jgi:hypothetical protein
VLGAEFASRANRIAPVELRMWPVAEADFLFEEADLIPCFARINRRGAFQLAQGAEYFNALPRRSEHTRSWNLGKERDR